MSPLISAQRRVFSGTLALLSLSFVALASRVKMDCKALAVAFPQITYLPSTPQYENSTCSYFAAFENEIHPSCVITPRSTQEVADVIKSLQQAPASLKIAIRGGGHTPWAGAANINAGVTIDMRQLNGVSVDAKNVVSIAAGNSWGDVYTKLQTKGLAVVGGRVSKVGVTGLTIGGLSYFSETRGFVCDSVVNFEVVLSSGKIVQANANTNPDLYRALKGGTNNFGVVTRFELPSFQQGNMWGGVLYYPSTTYAEIVDKLYNFASPAQPDPNAHLIVATAYSPAGSVNVVNAYYTKPTPNPPSLAPFVAVQPQLAQTLREDSLLGFASEQSSFSTNGDRQLFFTTTIKLNKQLLLDMEKLFHDTIEGVKTVPGLTISMVFQPLTKHILQQSALQGPNVLGLSPERGPLLITLLNSVHTNAADDAKVIAAVTDLLSKIEELARQRGLGERYKFLNYAYKTETPIQSYGPENVKFLQTVSKKYDPSGFFQSSVPGGFKLP
ncbi:hypothetical protein PMIN06_010392 [Paraphaeosphaeria minitans]